MNHRLENKIQRALRDVDKLKCDLERECPRPQTAQQVNLPQMGQVFVRPPDNALDALECLLKACGHRIVDCTPDKSPDKKPKKKSTRSK